MHGSPFFDGIAQVDAEIAGQPAKVPIFYYETSMMTALFPARYRGLQRLLPDSRFLPARLAPGLGVIAIGCLEHHETDIGPYNELAILIPLSVPAYRANPPGRALWRALRSGQMHAFVQHLPVTTEIALRGGVDFYNFPKFLATIEFDEESGRRRCRLAEGQEPILTMSGETRPAVRQGRMQYFLHLWMDGQPQQTEFKINQLQVATILRPGAAELELAERHPLAKELSRVLVSRRSLSYEYAPKLEGILYGPEHLTLPLLTRSLAATAGAERRTAGT